MGKVVAAVVVREGVFGQAPVTVQKKSQLLGLDVGCGHQCSQHLST